MQHEFEVEVTDSQYLSFRHEGKGYVIYQMTNTEEGEGIESTDLRLSEVVVIQGVNRASDILVSEYTNNFTTNKSDPITISESFVVKVNAYFSSLGGGSTGFPVKGSYYEQYDWIVGSGFSFSNGVLSLTL